jgi:hypothetical protein
LVPIGVVPIILGPSASEYSMVNGSNSYFLAAGASQNIVVQFSPATVSCSGTPPSAPMVSGPQAVLRIRNYLKSENTPVDVSLSGFGSEPVPDIDCNPASWDFGCVPVGSSSEKTFVISNKGGSDLKDTALAFTGPSASGFCMIGGGGAFILSPGTTRNIVVHFSPKGTDQENAQLRMTNNDPDENPFLINLSGMGGATTTLNISKSGPGQGQVKVNDVAWNIPYNSTFMPGLNITIQAMPDSCSIFQ